MSSLKTYLARERRLAKSAKTYNRKAEPTVTVSASDAAVTAAYKRGRSDAVKDQVKFSENIIERMDREMVQGWMNVMEEMNRLNPGAKMFTMSIQMVNAICRELGRAYERAGRVPSEDNVPPAKGEQS